MSEVNCVLLVHFVIVFETKKFLHFAIGTLQVKQIQKGIIFLNIFPRKNIAVVKEVKSSAHLKLFTLLVSSFISHFVLQELGMEQIWQLLRASLHLAMVAGNDHCVLEIFYIIIYAGERFVALINSVQFLPTVCDSAIWGDLVLLGIKASTVFMIHQLILQIAFVYEAIQAKAPKYSYSYSTEVSTAYIVLEK